jgi:branched-chain amino acid transport system permease protein
VPTFRYKLVAFVLSAFITALGGGLYALWFGFLDPVFQFSILVGAYMVLMSLLGGIRSLLGPFVGALIVGYAVEFFKAEYGDSQFHLVAMGLLLGAVVLFMPDGIIPALSQLVSRLRPQAASIREFSQAELAEQRRAGTAEDPGPSESDVASTRASQSAGSDRASEGARP